jgi:hypothetical protein
MEKRREMERGGGGRDVGKEEGLLHLGGAQVRRAELRLSSGVVFGDVELRERRFVLRRQDSWAHLFGRDGDSLQGKCVGCDAAQKSKIVGQHALARPSLLRSYALDCSSLKVRFRCWCSRSMRSQFALLRANRSSNSQS